jgi:hypothetical protein
MEKDITHQPVDSELLEDVLQVPLEVLRIVTPNDVVRSGPEGHEVGRLAGREEAASLWYFVGGRVLVSGKLDSAPISSGAASLRE